jgi:Ca-activated chloride channel family protein
MKGLLAFSFVALLPLWIAVGCGAGRNDTRTMSVLAGSELRDIEPLLPELERQTHVRLQLTYSGTLAGIDRLNAGEHFDAAWFSHAKYLVLSDPRRVKGQEKTMLSPVVLGIKESKARAFGWDNSSPTWADVAARVKAGELHYAMTNPTASNSGFSAVVGVAAALKGTSSALTASDVDQSKLRDFFSGQALTAGSSGWLAEAYVRDQEQLDGIINYESVLLSLNRGGQLHEQLVLIYPREGIVTADYPLVLLDTAKRAEFDTVLAVVRGARFQREIMTRTFRRPVNREVPLDAAFPRNLIVELDFPSDLDAINALLLTYLNRVRRPAHSLFVLDVSGSMKGQRLGQLKEAMNTLTGADSSLTGRFARFQERERVTLIPFSSRTEPESTVEVGTGAGFEHGLAQVRSMSDGLEAGGGTALYSAIAEAYREAREFMRQDPNRYYSIVLMTDGVSNDGMSADEFRTFYQSLPQEVRRVKVFPIIFGDASQEELKSVAELTGGRLFDGNKGALAPVFKEIRGYQ